MNVDDLMKVLQILTENRKYIRPIPFILSVFAFYFARQIPTLSIILLPMDGIMNILMALAWFFVIYKIFCFVYSPIEKYISQKRAIRRAEYLRIGALKFLKELPLSEKSLLKYMYHSPNDAVYVPCTDAAALSLLKKGALQQTIRATFPRVYGKGGRLTCSCYLYNILPDLKKLITEKYNSLNWEEVPALGKLNDYNKSRL